MATRRKFLRLLGVGAAGAPIAAQQMTQADAMGLTRMGDIRGHIASGTGFAEAIEDAEHSSAKEIHRATEAAKYLLNNGKLPPHVEERLRDDARDVRYLDYDIAQKCWSMAAKVHEQQQRNYQRSLTRYKTGDSYNIAQKAFEKATGFKWPW